MVLRVTTARRIDIVHLIRENVLRTGTECSTPRLRRGMASQLCPGKSCGGKNAPIAPCTGLTGLLSYVSGHSHVMIISELACCASAVGEPHQQLQ